MFSLSSAIPFEQVLCKSYSVANNETVVKISDIELITTYIANAIIFRKRRLQNQILKSRLKSEKTPKNKKRAWSRQDNEKKQPPKHSYRLSNTKASNFISTIEVLVKWKTSTQLQTSARKMYLLARQFNLTHSRNVTMLIMQSYTYIIALRPWRVSLSLKYINDVLHQILTSTAWADLELTNVHNWQTFSETTICTEHNRNTTSAFHKEKKEEKLLVDNKYKHKII